jgi:hypothetical protein
MGPFGDMLSPDALMCMGSRKTRFDGGLKILLDPSADSVA